MAGAAALLVAFTVSGSFRRWERWMYVLIAVNVVMLPLIFLHPPAPRRDRPRLRRARLSTAG